MFKLVCRLLLIAVFLFTGSVGFSQDQMLGGCVVTFELGDDIILCSSTSFYSLAVGSPAGGTYSGSGVLDDFFLASLAGPGEHIITYSYDNGFCIGTASDTITVVTAIPLLISGDLELCYGESTVITALTGENLEWESGSNETTETHNPIETTNYSLYGYDINGCLAAAGYTVVVHPLPIIVFSGDTSLCIGESTEIFASGAVDYIWSTNDDGESILVAPLIDSNFGVTATDEFGCVSSDSAAVTVHDYPVVEIEGDNEICIGGSTILSVNGSDSYAWNSVEGVASIVVTPIQDSIFTVVGTNQFGCSTADDYLVVVHSLPQVSISGDFELCLSETSELIASGAQDYIWDEGFVGATFTVNPTQSSQYVVTGTDEYGCSNLAAVDIIVHLITEVFPEILTPLPLCVGDSITVYIPDVLETFWLEDDIILNVDTIEVIATEEMLVLNFYALDLNGCPTEQSDLTVLSNLPPSLLMSGATEICPGDFSELIVSGADNYEWSNGNISDTLSIQLFESDEYSVSGFENGCSSELVFQLSLRSLPEVIISGEDHVCIGESAILEASGAENYTWSDGSEINPIEIETAENAEVSVIGIDEYGCSNTYSFMIMVDSIPDVIVSADNGEICLGETLLIHIHGALTYLWNTGEDDIWYEVSPSETTDYFVTGTDGNGCQETEYLTVIVHDLPVVEFELSVDTICDLATSINLNAIPTNGLFTGNGVSNNVFNPGTDNWGINDINYIYEDDNGCLTTVTQDIFVDDCTSITEYANLKLNIYPNPFLNTLQVLSEKNISSIRVFDLQGKLVLDFNNTTGRIFTLDTSMLNAGIYQLLIELENGLFVSEKISKN